MMTPAPSEEFTVRFPGPINGSGRQSELVVRGTVDHATKTITFELPDHTTTTLDVVTARALQMILWEGVFGALQPTGPRMRVERRVADDQPVPLSPAVLSPAVLSPAGLGTLDAA
jgi:hypothetical protein